MHLSDHYYLSPHKGLSTRSGNRVSQEHIREVWCSASYLQKNNKRITIRIVQLQSGISSSSIVAGAFRVLIDAGYMSRGPKWASSTWRILIPMYQYKEQKK